MIALIAFYLFAAVTIASAVAVIFARNPVHSVLWLILAFFNAAGLMLIMGAEFIAMLLVIVYVGAVAVLFLFVVMMLDIDFTQLRSGFNRNLPFGLLIAIVLLAEIVIATSAYNAGPALAGAPAAAGPDGSALRPRARRRGDRIAGRVVRGAASIDGSVGAWQTSSPLSARTWRAGRDACRFIRRVPQITPVDLAC